MAFKIAVALAFVAVASAGYVQPEQHVYHQAGPVEHTVALAPQQHVYAKNAEEFDPHPQYKYAYDVQDDITGDSKSQSETRNGDAVEGEYSLIDADGYKRIVHYTADDEHGFNAVVSRVPLHGAHEASAKSTPVAYATPSVVKTVAPVTYAAPSHYKSDPLNYAAPAEVKSVAHPVYSAPALYKSTPVAYSSPSYYKSDSVGYAAPTVVKTLGLASHNSPAYYKSAPVAQVAAESYVHAPETYSVPSAYVKSANYEHGYNH